ncbi:transposase [Halonatronum saccharophilum]|uniref:transposase n=1 Tax=Halonatronum saccharophilum TaxID=150060 RepID=UPI000480FD15
MKDEEHNKLLTLFKLSSKLEKAWELKEEFRDFLNLDNIDEATVALNQWYQRVSNSKLAPFNDSKGTVKHWETEILNYFNYKITNGYAEGINNKIKLVKRIGYGVPNINNLRCRVFNTVS